MDFPPARFARRHGFSKVSVRILPLRQAKYLNFPAGALRAPAWIHRGFPKDFAFAASQSLQEQGPATAPEPLIPMRQGHSHRVDCAGARVPLPSPCDEGGRRRDLLPALDGPSVWIRIIELASMKKVFFTEIISLDHHLAPGSVKKHSRYSVFHRIFFHLIINGSLALR